jgi:transcriptional regulator with XRE-family HTH domain
MVGKRFGNVDDHVGRRLRARRKELGISQVKLADALGISYQQVSKCESGVNRVSASRLWDIAQALEVGVGYFFEGIPKRAGRARKPSAGRRVGAKTARRKGRGARR